MLDSLTPPNVFHAFDWNFDCPRIWLGSSIYRKEIEKLIEERLAVAESDSFELVESLSGSGIVISSQRFRKEKQKVTIGKLENYV